MDVVVVNHNTAELLATCLSSLHEASRVVVVDNASTDGSAAMVARDHPEVELLANRRNVGFGAAVNQGFARCGAEYVLVLNSDTRVEPGTLQALSEYLDQHPCVALVGPRLIDPDGRLLASCHAFPTLLPTFLEESALWPILGYVPILGGLYPQTASYARARQVGWVEGAAMAIRRAAFEAVCGFDASYFLYFEEVDLCYRLAAAGWQVHFAPVGTLMHVRGASTRQYRSDTAIMALAGRLHFYRKHYPPWRVAAMVIIVQLVLVARCLLAPVRIRRARSEGQRARLQHEASAWRRALGGEWLRPRARAFTR